MDTTLAWIGSVAFAVCGIPAAMSAYRAKRCHYNRGFLMLWTLGEVCLTLYALRTGQYPLLLNYVLNMCCIVVLLYYNEPRSPEESLCLSERDYRPQSAYPSIQQSYFSVRNEKIGENS